MKLKNIHMQIQTRRETLIKQMYNVARILNNKFIHSDVLNLQLVSTITIIIIIPHILNTSLSGTRCCFLINN